MKLVDMKITEFVDVLGSDAPAPGGGSASALAASVGSALTMMVAQLTIGKKKYVEYDELMKQVLKEATEVNQALLEAIDKDTEAFNQVSAVFSMPKETDEEKAARKEAMQKALKLAAEAPYDIMTLASKAITITGKAVGKSNVNAASDLGVAALNLKSGLQGAWLNVLINLSGIKDEAFVAKYKKDGEALLQTSCDRADEIYQAILEIV
ncbi:cyclodeaminase/cyclohydrolase family protein [Listeria aquatica]|uniref:Cyclodeaminase/cyclohydrolase family protein n=1 Tax=Listeria aquatica TaxID=1494960 RepID=A0A841ZLA7_9LIST|nr:cyclodeaminase/cyclohydrolase family protein [Listeria aquatica]MBC1520044.1 cyclodeaminase/cyclohydrolase family protein [Listeria aquatica]